MEHLNVAGHVQYNFHRKKRIWLCIHEIKNSLQLKLVKLVKWKRYMHIRFHLHMHKYMHITPNLYLKESGLIFTFVLTKNTF